MTETRLSDEAIAAHVRTSRWRRQDDALVQDVELENFAAVIAAVNRVAAVAEEHNHHPDLLIHGWNKLQIRLSTHSAGGITQADAELAARIDGLL
jgi:4a-hydroxytetrahydrobiopterin dehydratase